MLGVPGVAAEREVRVPSRLDLRLDARFDVAMGEFYHARRSRRSGIRSTILPVHPVTSMVVRVGAFFRVVLFVSPWGRKQ